MKPSNRERLKNQPAGAFTLIETLVSIAIVGLLAALVLSALQSARESSRRVACTSNLHQLGLAFHSYQASIGSLPHTTNAKKGFSIHSMILSHIGKSNLYNSINYSLAPDAEQNITASHTSLAVFLCPSDAGQGKPCSNYAANTGYGYQVNGRKFNGMFVKPPLSPTSLSNIPDGASNTSLMTEWVLGSGNTSIFHSLGSAYYTPTRLLKPQEFDQFITSCLNASLTGAGKFFAAKGTRWTDSSCGLSTYNHNLTPNNKSCLNHKFYFEGAWTASSFHSGGVNVVLADGHVRFVRDSIGIALWRATGTRSGGEIVAPGD